MIILGLGSNVGDREAHLRRAVARLAEMMGSLATSRVLESTAHLPPDAPADWNKPYLNMAVATATTPLTPQELLSDIKIIEAELGRVDRGLWGPREIDIDILAFGEEIIHSPDLIVPHSKMLTRDFVLLPVADVAPQWRYPVTGHYFGKTASAITAEFQFGLNKDLRETGIGIYA